jgi:hypothetical protein
MYLEYEMGDTCWNGSSPWMTADVACNQLSKMPLYLDLRCRQTRTLERVQFRQGRAWLGIAALQPGDEVMANLHVGPSQLGGALVVRRMGFLAMMVSVVRRSIGLFLNFPTVCVADFAVVYPPPSRRA